MGEFRYTDEERTFAVYVPEGFEGVPTDVVDALKRARVLMAEENRWRTSHWYTCEFPDVDPNTPFCDNWQSCAEGALGVVTVGASTRTRELERSRAAVQGPLLVDWGFNPDSQAPGDRRDLYEAGKVLLMKAGHILWPDVDNTHRTATGEEVRNAWTYNDMMPNVQRVLDWFDKAIEVAEEEANA